MPAAMIVGMTAAWTLRDRNSGALIQRPAPLAERLIAGNPDRYEVVPTVRATAIVQALPPLDSRRRRARQPVPPGLALPDDAA